MRVDFVIQRYGAEVAGGAEALCRRTAAAMADAGHAVTVHTTTARDYLSWAPHYPPGTSRDGRVIVRRYPVEPADPARASTLVRQLALDDTDADAECAWAIAQGPVAPGLVDAIAGPGPADVVVCWTYLYATSQLAMAAATTPTVLVPLAHNEPMLRFPLVRGMMRRARAFAFQTPEEALLVDDLHRIDGRPAAVVGTGLDPAADACPEPARSDFDLPERFALYLGRVDPAKGIDELIDFHGRYRRDGGDLGLVLAGRPTVTVPVPDWVVATGFVTEPQRESLLAAATCVVLPSHHESLSLVALEAWQRRTPTVANAHSEVLAGQTRRSGAGLLYADAHGYSEALRGLEADPAAMRTMEASGLRFTAGLTWPACVQRWEALLHRVVG